MPSRASPRRSRSRRTTLEHVILAGCSHAPAVELAEQLLAIAPREAGREPLTKVFYADNGSAGVEVALKMAFHWFRNRGIDGRTKFIALDNGYHGETLGALAVGDIPLYRRVYAPLLAEALFAPSPDAYLCEAGETPADRARRAADALARSARAPRRRGLRADPGAARAVRRRHAHARPAVPAAGARAVRCAWRVPDRRRDRRRLRPHRHDVRQRAEPAYSRTCCACPRA